LSSCYLVIELSGFLKTFSAKRIDGYIGDNPIEPSLKRGLSFEPVDRAPRLYEAFLRQIPGVLFILDHSVNHGKDLAPVFDDQLFESEGIPFLTPPNQSNVIVLHRLS
jgi:hypothetical protein